MNPKIIIFKISHTLSKGTVQFLDRQSSKNSNWHVINLGFLLLGLMLVLSGSRPALASLEIKAPVFNAGSSDNTDNGSFSFSSRLIGSHPSKKQLEISSPTADFEDIGAILQGVIYGYTAWGDYDNDNDQDILLMGCVISVNNYCTNAVTKIYRNDRNGSFVDLDASLPGLSSGSAAWGDYDNDNDLDILLTGCPGNCSVGTTKVYRNNGNGSFTDIGASLTPAGYSFAAWGDYDVDGKLDILLTGYDGTTYITEIYHNNSDGSFSKRVTLQGVAWASVAWGDYDNDGDLDILLAGYNTACQQSAKIYRNDRNNVFTDIGASLPGAWYSSVAWGDYDNDGDLDILLTGDTGFGRITKVYNNDGNTFYDINAQLIGVWQSSAAWGDFDNDGDLDILLSGYTNSSTRVTKVYRNEGDGNFQDINAPLTWTAYGSVSWGDYDNDNDLDILLTGEDGSSYIAKVYRNTSNTPNTAPSTPSNLRSDQSGTSLIINWDSASDDQTPPDGLSYNLRIGTTPGGEQIVSPMAAFSNGYRLLPAIGNNQGGTSSNLKNLSPGTYYWSVQAIDTAFVGSKFADEIAFYLIPMPGFFSKRTPTMHEANISTSPTLSWQASNDVSTYEYCYDTINNATCDRTWISAGTAISVTLNGLNAETDYYWQARASNKAGITEANNGIWWHFKTQYFRVFLPAVMVQNSPISTSKTPSWSSTQINNSTPTPSSLGTADPPPPTIP